jgi:hypothetical protein
MMFNVYNTFKTLEKKENFLFKRSKRKNTYSSIQLTTYMQLHLRRMTYKTG